MDAVGQRSATGVTGVVTAGVVTTGVVAVTATVVDAPPPQPISSVNVKVLTAIPNLVGRLVAVEERLNLWMNVMWAVPWITG